MFRKLLLGAATLMLVGAGAYGTSVMLAGSTPAGATASPPAIAPVSFADLADRLLPTVVNISSTQKIDPGAVPQGLPEMPEFPEGSPFEEFFNDYMKRNQEQLQATPPTSLGSGFIIDIDKGYIVTNNHVIKDAQEIRVTLHDNSIVNASIIGKDEKTDLALLQADLKGHDIKAAMLGNSDGLRVGDWVMAIGNPFGLGGTVTAGIVSARKRDINAGPYDDFIQTDASINRGNSGGPMFNLRGDVIGINTAIYSPSGGSVGIGFAIPSSMAKTVLDQLVKYGKTRRGWLGVRIQTVTDEIAESLSLNKARGALVASLTATGPAEKAGLKPGDVVIAFDGKPVDDMRALPKIVADTEIGKTTDITVWRDGKETTMKVAVGELEVAEEQGLVEKQTPAEAMQPQSGEDVPQLGTKLLALTPEIRTQFGIVSDVNGLVVMDVDPDSDALRKGLSEGDVIVEMNQTPVVTVQDAKDVVASTIKAGKSSVLLLINRQGDIQFIAVKLAKDAKPEKPVTPEPAPENPVPAPSEPAPELAPGLPADPEKLPE